MTHKPHTLNRREFIGTLIAAGGGAMFAGLGAESARAAQSAPTLLPTRTTPEGLAQVVLVKTQDRAAGVRRALELFGQNPVQGKKVLLKPNWNTSDAPPGCTHNDTLSAFVTWLQDSGAEGVTVGDRSYQGAHSVMQANGIYDMAAAMGFETVALDALPAQPENWHWVQPESSHWQHGFNVARAIWEAESVVSTCCLKTHRYGGEYTITLKNAVGILPKIGPCGDRQVRLMDELHGARDTHMRKMIAEINLGWSPDVYVVDAVEAFVDGGPMVGTVAQTEAVLVGTDRVALDAVGVAILRKFGAKSPVSDGRIFDTAQIARAVELGIGVDSPDKIEFVTDDNVSAAYARELQDLLFM